MLARCPSCRNTFRAVRTGRQDCPVCGKPLVVPEGLPSAPVQQEGGPASTAGLPPIDGPPASPEGTPWERRAQLGVWKGWTQTVSQALLAPTKLYASARLDRGSAQLGFAVATGSLFWVAGQALDHLVFSRQRAQVLELWREQVPGTGSLPPRVGRLVEFMIGHAGVVTLVSTLFAPLLVFVLLYANAGVTHLCAVLFGQNRRGFPATFAAAAYGVAPVVLFAIPGCGGLAGLIWCAVLTGIGLKVAHGISSGGAVATALAPYAFLCCATCAFTLALGLIAARVAQAGG